MRNAVIWAGAGASILALTTVSDAQVDDLLPRIAVAWNPDPSEHSQLMVNCHRTGPTTIECQHIQTMLTVPSKQAIEAKIAEREAEVPAFVKTPAKFAALCKKVEANLKAADAQAAKTGKPWFAPTDGSAVDTKALGALCKTKDVKVYLQTMADFDRSVKAKTCEVFVSEYSDTYARVDDDTWVGTTTTPSLLGCNSSRISTLWRNGKQKDASSDWRPWNHKQVRSVPPNADPTKCPTNATVEHRADGLKTRKVDCVYMKI